MIGNLFEFASTMCGSSIDHLIIIAGVWYKLIQASSLLLWTTPSLQTPLFLKNKERGSQPVWKFICSGTVQLKRSSFEVLIQCRWPKLWQIPWAAINQKQDQRLNLTSDMRNKWKSKTIGSLFCCVEWYLFKFYPSMPGPKVPLWSLFLAQIPSSIIPSILVLLPVPYIHRGFIRLFGLY